MNAKKINSLQLKIPYRFCRMAILPIVFLFALTGCSHPPCEKYLNERLVLKPRRLVQAPKPIPNIIRRQYDLCLLKRMGVGIVRQGQTWKFVFPSDDLFDNDTAEINIRYKSVLNVAADFMRTYSKKAVTVNAYTNKSDDDILTKFGMVSDELTQRQAEAVESYLMDHGANARFIYAAGKGSGHPIAWEGSPAGRRLNRRVEVSFRYYKDNTAWY